MRISQLTLQTRNVDIMRGFYCDLLGFPVSHSDKEKLGIRVGASEVIFPQDKQQDVYYHFAFNIPENQICPSVTWLKSLWTELLTYKGNEIIKFDDPFDAETGYLHDPVTRTGELELD